MNLYNYEEKPKFKSRPEDRKQINTPWNASVFEPKPSKPELLAKKDGETFRRTSTLRILGAPHRFKQIWLSPRDKQAGFYQYIGDLPGMTIELPVERNGKTELQEVARDLIQDQIGALEDELRDMKFAKDEEGNRVYSKEECDEFWTTKIKGKSYRPMWAFEVLDKGIYHYDGRDVVDCTGRKCLYCKAGEQKHFGGRKVWSINQALFRQLMAIDGEIYWKSCSEDKEFCGIDIDLDDLHGLHCSSCNELLVDGADAKQKFSTKDNFRKHVCTKKYKCPSCGNHDFSRAVFEIDGNMVLPSTLLDVDITVTYQGEKASITRGGTTYPRIAKGSSQTSVNFVAESLYPTPQWEGLEYEAGETAEEDTFKYEGNILWPKKVERFFQPFARKPYQVKRDDFENNEEYNQALLRAQSHLTGIPIPPEWLPKIEDTQEDSFDEIPF